ncbi:MAG: hypothetical protein WAV56_02215 [Microgenomates group bacterium]
MDSKNLASRLCYLPLFVSDRIKLWLTYRALKPASLIAFRGSSYPQTPTRLHRIQKWVKDAGLFIKLDPFDPKKSVYIVSKDQSAIKKLTKMKSPPSNDDCHTMGLLFGYPPAAVKTYSYGDPSQMTGSLSKDSPVKALPEALYAEYAIRLGHEKDDLGVAKKWMETIRKDIPKLAEWYEKESKTAIEN